MTRPHQKAASNKNIERAYDAMLEACTTQRTFIEKNKRVPYPVVIRMRAQYAKNIKAIIEAKYALTVALVKPVSPCGSDVMSDSTKFIVDRLLSGEFNLVVTKSKELEPLVHSTYTTRVTATDKSIPLTITFESAVTTQVPSGFPNACSGRGLRTRKFTVNTSIPSLFTEREIEFMDANYYTDIFRAAKRIKEEADRAVEQAAAMGAIKEVTKLYKEAGIGIPK